MMADVSKIILVEDDILLGELTVEYLSSHGFLVEHAVSGIEGIQKILYNQPDLAIIDLLLPEFDGLEVCKRVRSEYLGPILMLTASKSDTDHIRCIESYADDFISKPVDSRILLARIRNLLSRSSSSHSSQAHVDSVDSLNVDQYGFFKVQKTQRQITWSQQLIPLTNIEYEILLALIKAQGEVITRDTLFTEIFGSSYDGLNRGLDVHISRIRKKLIQMGGDGSRIKSIRGEGYLLLL